MPTTASMLAHGRKNLCVSLKKVLTKHFLVFMNALMPKADLYILDTEALEAARRARLLTLSELQERAGIGVKTLWMARTGRAVSLATAKVIARALRVSVRSLLGESVDSHGRSSACA